MARKTLPLSPTEIANAKPKEKEYNLMDGDGLKLRIKPSGAKTWIFNYYRPHTKKRANQTLGTFPGLSLKDARRLADNSRALLAQNIDPQEHAKEIAESETERLSNTLEVIAAKWMEIKKSDITADHAEDIWRSLENHVLSELGNVPVTKVSARMAIDTLEKVAQGIAGNRQTTLPKTQRSYDLCRQF